MYERFFDGMVKSEIENLAADGINVEPISLAQQSSKVSVLNKMLCALEDEPSTSGRYFLTMRTRVVPACWDISSQDPVQVPSQLPLYQRATSSSLND